MAHKLTSDPGRITAAIRRAIEMSGASGASDDWVIFQTIAALLPDALQPVQRLDATTAIARAGGIDVAQLGFQRADDFAAG